MQNGSTVPKRLTEDTFTNGYQMSEDLSSNTEGRRRGQFAQQTVESGINEDDNEEGPESDGPANSNVNEEEEEVHFGAAVDHKVSIRDRIGCFTWTWFTMTMATGGIANVLHTIPYRARWLETLGVVVFIFNICLFILNCVLNCLRFKFRKGAFRASFSDQSESLFVPAIIVSIGTILTNVCQYGIPHTGTWLCSTMAVLFWIYFFLSMVGSAGIYLMLWSTQAFPLNTMTPIWIFPAYPLLLLATFASNLIDAMPSQEEAERQNAIAITFGAVVGQGTGFLVSLMIYGAFIYRLMTQKLPKESLRPGIFVSVGPSGFTVAGIVHLGNDLATKTLPDGYMGHADASFFMKLIADLVGLWLWGLCIWFFMVSVGSHWSFFHGRKDPDHRMKFAMTWYSFIFPNTALTTATFQIGKAFNSRAILVVGTVMSVILCIVWIMVFGTMIRALMRRQLLWPDVKTKRRGIASLNV